MSACETLAVCERLVAAKERVSQQAAVDPVSPSSPKSERDPSHFEPGARVEHLQWGMGTVLGYEGESRDKLLVRFDQAGDKLLAVSMLEQTLVDRSGQPA